MCLDYTRVTALLLWVCKLLNLHIETKQKNTNKKNALRDHTLKMNGPFLEKTLSDLASKALSSSGLGMIPDIAAGAGADQARIAIVAAISLKLQ